MLFSFPAFLKSYAWRLCIFINSIIKIENCQLFVQIAENINAELQQILSFNFKSLNSFLRAIHDVFIRNPANGFENRRLIRLTRLTA